jgi:hypothetical protein
MINVSAIVGWVRLLRSFAASGGAEGVREEPL